MLVGNSDVDLRCICLFFKKLLIIVCKEGWISEYEERGKGVCVWQKRDWRLKILLGELNWGLQL